MSAAKRGRILWLEALRIAAAFLVIVNHTNSDVFQASDPGQLTWHLSILWYYVSKTAVPLFVMISGAVLLNRQDGWRKTLARVGRVVLVLVLASYAYFLYDAWVNWGLWPRAIRLDILFGKIIRLEITDGFWYLYFYIALLLTMPLWQWISCKLSNEQKLHLVAATIAFGAALPLIGHYIPRLALPEKIMACIPVSYIGLLFAGSYIRDLPPLTRQVRSYAVLGICASLLFSWALTWLEYVQVAPGTKYWFMDHRLIPALPVTTASLCAMLLAKSLGEKPDAAEVTSAKGSAWVAELGGCAFGIYLAQDLLIAETEHRLFQPLCQHMPPMAAVLLWEAAVFAAALLLIWLLRRIPFLRRIL